MRCLLSSLVRRHSQKDTNEFLLEMELRHLTRLRRLLLIEFASASGRSLELVEARSQKVSLERTKLSQSEEVFLNYNSVRM